MSARLVITLVTRTAHVKTLLGATSALATRDIKAKVGIVDAKTVVSEK